MRFIVDEMPDYEEECPFYKSMLWISDCVKKSHACFITKKSCDRTDGGCHMLKPIKGETLYTLMQWDGGMDFQYINHVKFCPVCGRELSDE